MSKLKKVLALVLAALLLLGTLTACGGGNASANVNNGEVN